MDISFRVPLCPGDVKALGEMKLHVCTRLCVCVLADARCTNNAYFSARRRVYARKLIFRSQNGRICSNNTSVGRVASEMKPAAQKRRTKVERRCRFYRRRPVADA